MKSKKKITFILQSPLLCKAERETHTERDRQKDRKRGKDREREKESVCVCVRERERRERADRAIEIVRWTNTEICWRQTQYWVGLNGPMTTNPTETITHTAMTERNLNKFHNNNG